MKYRHSQAQLKQPNTIRQEHDGLKAIKDLE